MTREVTRMFLGLVLGLAVAVPDAAQRPRIAVGAVTAESNSLYPRAQAMVEQTRSRNAWWDEHARDSTIASGIIEASGRLGLDIHPILHAGASSLGYVDRASFEAAAGKLVEQLKTAQPRFDGVILTLHGAMVVEGYPHGDAEVVRRVRAAMGRQFPIVVTHDFHANVSEEIVKQSDFNHLQGEPARRYQGAGKPGGHHHRPHDQRRSPAGAEDGQASDDRQHHLSEHLRGAVQAGDRCQPAARKSNPKILAASVPGGYQWADVPAMGPSVIVVSDNDPDLAQREAQRLSDMLWDLRSKLPFDTRARGGGARGHGQPEVSGGPDGHRGQHRRRIGGGRHLRPGGAAEAEGGGLGNRDLG